MSGTIRLATVLAATVLALAGPLGAQEEPAATAPLVRPARGLLFVGAQDNEPFSYLNPDGQPAGFDVDVIDAIAERLGVPIAVRLLPAEEALAVARDGRADGLVGLGVLPDQPDTREQWQLCGPTIRRVYRIFIRAGNRWLSDRAVIRDLAGTRVAVLANDPVRNFLANDRSLGPGGLALEPLDRPRNACLWVSNRRATAFIADENVIRHGAAQTEGRLVGPPVYEISQWGPAVPLPNDPDDAADPNGRTALAQRIRGAVVAMDGPGGQLESLRRQWFGQRLKGLPFWRQSWFVPALVGVALAVVLVAGAHYGRRGFLAAVERRTRRLHAEAEVLRRQVADLRARLEQPAAPADEPLDEPEVVDAEPVDEDDAPDGQAAVTSIAEADSPAALAQGGAPLELNELVRSCEPELKETIGPEVRLHVALGENLPAVLGQADRIRQMLVYLCANGRDAILERRRTERNFHERIWVSTRRPGAKERPPNPAFAGKAFVTLSVRDTGCGIAAGQVQKIFQSGFTTKPDAPGHGLAFVYEVVAQHGGWIDVESAVGRGATFSIYLPAVDV